MSTEDTKTVETTETDTQETLELTTFDKLRELVNSDKAREDWNKATASGKYAGRRGNKSAAKRFRKRMQEVRRTAYDLRVEMLPITKVPPRKKVVAASPEA